MLSRFPPSGFAIQFYRQTRHILYLQAARYVRRHRMMLRPRDD